MVEQACRLEWLALMFHILVSHNSLRYWEKVKVQAKPKLTVGQEALSSTRLVPISHKFSRFSSLGVTAAGVFALLVWVVCSCCEITWAACSLPLPIDTYVLNSLF
jgi:hypothetical protein